MAKSSRARLFEAGEGNIAKDHDPEADGPAYDVDSDSASSEDENAGTEHYVEVGKSKLRQKDSASLGPQYRGSRVSREALEDDLDLDEDEDEESDEGEGYADPSLVDLEADEAAANDSEIDSEDALADSDEEKLDNFVFRGSGKPKVKKSKRAVAADFLSSDGDSEELDGGAGLDDEDSEGDEDEDMDDGLDDLLNGSSRFDQDLSGEDEDEDDEDDENEDVEEDEDEDEEGEDEEDEDEDNADEDDVAAKAKKSAASERSDRLNAEVQKGLAIQQQRKTYDGLLNLRIRLQKALVAVNTFSVAEDDSTEDAEPYAAAEEAAFKLLNTVSTLRENLLPPRKSGTKRKRELELDMSSAEIWEELCAPEKQLAKHRDATLEKWSKKTETGTTRRDADRLSGKPARKTLNAALRDQLEDPEKRLVKRTRIPRSCAPVQASKKMLDDASIYDDADFYQLLLKELVEQRTVESSAADAAKAVAGATTVMLTAAKDAKMRKEVDRKASKGRKMRFTVHEKLQNFMAPEDRRSWEGDAIDRFFGTLFGQKMVLDEDDVVSDDEDEELEASGLRLFG